MKECKNCGEPTDEGELCEYCASLKAEIITFEKIDKLRREGVFVEPYDRKKGK